MVEFRVLGPLEVREGDELFPVGGAKQRALLALLLLSANRVVSRERLIDDLWGGDPPERAVAAVQVYVSRLRKLLPDGVLVTRPPGYLLRVGPGELDLERFECLRVEGRLHEALALWRGPPLAEFEEPFARVEAARLEDLRVAVLEERIEADLAQGCLAELVGELETLVVEYPHRERLRAELMLAFYRSGRQAEALAAYRDARAALDELGLEPSATLRQLERQILTQDAALDLGPQLLLTDERVPLPGPLVPESPFPFVGRANELEKLRLLLERAEGGEGGLALLTGEPGAGKTRLVREFAHEATGRGTLILYGVSDAVVSTPYQPLREWIRFLLRICEPEALRQSLGGEGGQLARLVPELAQLTGTPHELSGDSEADRYRLQSAAADALTRMSRAQPLLLVADDLHWADSEMLGLLRRLARAAPEERVLIVVAFRDPGEEITPQLADTLADLSRLDAVSRLALHGLTADELGAFVHASTDAKASPELTSAIGELTDGTPLLVCELWRDLRESGGVEVSDRGAMLSRPVGELRGPERIHEAVQQRLSRLTVETRQMIELAAVAGARFELRAVAHAAGLDPKGLVDALEEAEGSGIIEELPDQTPTGRFSHELVRRAIYDRISAIHRAELHLLVGEALEQGHLADLNGVLPELAHHFTLAAPVAGVERAIDYNLRAAEAATASLAYSEATSRLATALELGIDDHHERTRIQIELGYLYHETGRMAESEAVLVAATDATTSLEDRGLATRALVQLSDERLQSDPSVGSAEILPIAEQAVRTLEQLGDLLGLAKAEHLLSHVLEREGRTDESLDVLQRALAHADTYGDPVMQRQAIGRLCLQLAVNTPPAGEAIDRLEKLRPLTRSDPMLEAALRRCLAHVLAMAGRFDEAREHIRASAKVLDGADETTFSLSSRWQAAGAEVLVGDLAGAERDLVAAFVSMRDSRGEESEARALRASGELALFYCDQGRWEEAADSLSYGQEVDRRPPVVGKAYTILRLAARARVAAHQGMLDEALDLARVAVPIAERSDWLNMRASVWLAFAEVQRAAGDEAEADVGVSRALELYEQKGNIAAASRLRDERGIQHGQR